MKNREEGTIEDTIPQKRDKSLTQVEELTLDGKKDFFFLFFFLSEEGR